MLLNLIYKIPKKCRLVVSFLLCKYNSEFIEGKHGTEISPFKLSHSQAKRWNDCTVILPSVYNKQLHVSLSD